MRNILNSICSFYDVDKSIVFENRRKGDNILYRHLLCYLIYTLEKRTTFQEIVTYLNWNGSDICNHSTIINAKRRVEERLSYDKAFRLEVETLKTIINESKNNDFICVTKVDLVNEISR